MSYDRIVRENFDTYLKTAPANSELKRVMKSHQITKRFLLNMALEIEKLQTDRIKKGKPLIKTKTISWLVNQMTDFMLECAKKAADNNYMSDLERSRLTTKAQEQLDMDKTLEGNPSGIFEELGVYDGERLNGSRLDGEIKQEAYAQIRQDKPEV